MAPKFTKVLVEEILEQYPAHPKSERIRYMPYDPAIIVPLVQQQWIDAAVIPASDELKAALACPANTIHPRDISQCSVALKSFVSNGVPSQLNAVHRDHMARTHEFIRATGVKDDKIRSFLFSYHPKADTCFEPCLHVDLALNTYTATFGAPMEFYAGHFPDEWIGGLIIGCRTWEEQKQFLKNKGICEDIDQCLDSFDIGDIVVFGPRLIHRSSRLVANGPDHEGQGLIGYGLNPKNSPHPLF